MTEARSKYIAWVATATVPVLIVIILWSYQQTVVAVQMVYGGSGDTLDSLFPWMVGFVIQFAPTPFWVGAHFSAKAGDHLIAFMLTMAGWAFTLVDAVSNLVAYFGMQFDGDIYKFFDTSPLVMIMQIFLVVFLLLVTQFEEVLAVLVGVAAHHFGHPTLMRRAKAATPISATA